MTTQTLRGMDNHGSMHWRGDRTGGNDEPGSQANNTGAYNEVLGFKKFDVAFEGLLGRDTPASDAMMQAFAEFILQVLPPPNPIRNLDDSLTVQQSAGRDFYFNATVDTTTCNGCHVLDPAAGFFGGDGKASFEGEPQHMKIPQLRNMYSKVGMFGMPAVAFFNPGDNAPRGDQVRGFGFLHDGSVDTLLHADDNCPAVANSTQNDNDAVGDVCDADDDNDGLVDVLETAIGTDPLQEDSDGDTLLDGVDPIPLTVNIGDGDGDGDGDLAPWNLPDGVVNAADVMIATRLALGLLTAGNEQLARGDLYPPGAPDGVINTQDLILLMQGVLQ